MINTNTWLIDLKNDCTDDAPKGTHFRTVAFSHKDQNAIILFFMDSMHNILDHIYISRAAAITKYRYNITGDRGTTGQMPSKYTKAERTQEYISKNNL